MYKHGNYSFIESVNDLSEIVSEETAPALLVFLDVAAAANYFQVTEEVMEEVLETLDNQCRLATEAAIEAELN